MKIELTIYGICQRQTNKVFYLNGAIFKKIKIDNFTCHLYNNHKKFENPNYILFPFFFIYYSADLPMKGRIKFIQKQKPHLVFFIRQKYRFP